MDWTTSQDLTNILTEKSWDPIIKSEYDKDYYKKMSDSLKQEVIDLKGILQIYPHRSLVFNAFNLCSFDNTKVVILGQDCYHTPGMANGLAFSVSKDMSLPPSLRNIYKELESDGFKTPKHGDLTSWATQGVLMLNCALTVVEGKPNSHKDIWTEFTDHVIKELSDKKKGLVFMLWGNYAKAKKKLINKNNNHHLLESAHPSPLSANNGGWFGKKQFSKANQLLINMDLEPIDWNIQ